MTDTDSTSNENFSFVKNEQDVLTFWNEKKIFEKSLEKTKSNAPYIFYDGPPFATGLPHHGHLLASTLKDIVPRYWTMKGRYVERRFGWDCHGLPVEQEIDKKFGKSAQDIVAEFGVKKYNDECRGIVQRYVKEWEKTVTRIGRWVDFENDYKTMDKPYMESCWWVFKELWDKGLVYQGTKVMPFSTALGTVLSNFEATSNYQDVQDPAVTVLFKVDGEENSYFAAWTTTPWTLPSNLCLCVGAEIDYVKVNEVESGKNIYIAKSRLEHYSKKRELNIIEEMKGSDLKGKTYTPLFDFFKELKAEGAFQILNDDYVTTGDGTGIVHTAPAFGEDDNRIMKEAGIEAIVCPIDDAGKFKKSVTTYAGQYVKDADKLIIKDIKEAGHLLEQSVLVHSYPFCPRTDTPLIYKTIPSWFIAVEKIKEDLIANNQKINWVPGHIKDGRFGKWLEGARDWAVSRNRVWGTPLPIWRNSETENCICVGSIEELKAVSGVELSDLHREFTDDITFSVSGEEGTYKRIPEVFDCWFESGSMPYAQLHYPFENKDVFENGYPAEFIAEGLDQTRGWFYTLTVLSTALFNKPAFKNVIVNGLVMAEDGKKMSKRLQNYTAPDALMQDYGADALRLYLINSGLVKGEEQRFADIGVKDMVRRALLPWYNSYKFFQTYASVDGWNVQENFVEGDNIVDQWILSKLQTLKQNIAKEMEEYKLYNVVPALFNFIEDLTNWYIRLNRSRFWGEGLNDDKCAAYSTLHYVLTEISKCMAPFTPFLSEYTYSELKKFNANETEESVHLCDYPVASEDKIKPMLEDAVDRMQQLILLGRQKRNQVQIKVKTPLAKLTVIHKDKDLLDEISKLESYIQTELNIKKIEYSTEENEFIKLFAKPNFKVLGKKLGKRMGQFGKLIQALNADDLASLEEHGFIELGGEKFVTEDIDIFREAKEGTQAVSNRFISIDMDVELTEELIEEGLAREVVNRIQRSRKDMGFNIEDRILVEYSGDEKIISSIAKYSDYIAGETLSNSITKSDNNTGIEFKIDEICLYLTITKA